MTDTFKTFLQPTSKPAPIDRGHVGNWHATECYFWVRVSRARKQGLARATGLDRRVSRGTKKTPGGSNTAQRTVGNLLQIQRPGEVVLALPGRGFSGVMHSICLDGSYWPFKSP